MNILILGNTIPHSIDCSLAFHGFEDLEANITISNQYLRFSESDLQSYDCCVGGLNFSRWILFILGIKNYDISCYPKQLEHFLFRNIYTTELNQIINNIPKNRFIKPTKSKRFNAFISNSDTCLDNLVNLDDNETIYISDLIDFISEWRVYVRNSNIENICFYKGNCTLFPNVNTIRQMIQSYSDSPCCYALDVGISNIPNKNLFNITTLVEINDFYSIGNYGLDPTTYAKMLFERWQQITTKD
jgi:ATP-grasp domain, R2K clade family 2